jgi:hypothetical protein
MTVHGFLLTNLAMAFYNIGAIWAHEIDIFRSWRLLDPDTFHRVQSLRWRKLPYWVFVLAGLTLAGSIVLVWHHPPQSPARGIWGNITCQIAAIILTAAFWGPWQASLSRDPRGPAGPYLVQILSTHWIRTFW